MVTLGWLKVTAFGLRRAQWLKCWLICNIWQILLAREEKPGWQVEEWGGSQHRIYVSTHIETHAYAVSGCFPWEVSRGCCCKLACHLMTLGDNHFATLMHISRLDKVWASTFQCNAICRQLSNKFSRLKYFITALQYKLHLHILYGSGICWMPTPKQIHNTVRAWLFSINTQAFTPKAPWARDLGAVINLNTLINNADGFGVRVHVLLLVWSWKHWSV